MFSKLNKALVLATALTLTAAAAQAVTVQAVAYGRADLDALARIANPTATSTSLRSRARAGVYEGVTRNLRRTYRTPWRAASRPVRRSATFTAVRAATARYEFGADQAGLSLLWGSTGRRDRLSLFNDGVLVTRIIPGVANPGSETVPRGGGGTYFVTVSDVLFDEIRISNNRGAFEFANLQVVPAVPLPAGGVLLLTALGGIALMRRKRA
ncbi:VPLPA-CTERM sorting domain-containing protein [Tateyamaria armeniaca]|uniref:VPLPA-CTERM sorting domain-containing protein n=1 Tax=Tateyamaria armeniaca TaxID=2518930 RepID=A0ABW8UZD7_9RHOB